MKTDLNNQVDAFFKKYSLSEINIENIKTCFPNLQVENDYGTLLHAAVQYQYPEENVLIFIKCLLENGVDVNKKGKYTGYSFIHLALYGYTDEEGEDHSYSTEFMTKLIQIAISYGLDVQIVDDDQDSIIHTAIASEVYTGKTINLIKALGNRFDCRCSDNQGRNIYQALLDYQAEAQAENNSDWYNRLASEKQAIKAVLKLDESSLYELDKVEESSVETKQNTVENEKTVDTIESLSEKEEPVIVPISVPEVPFFDREYLIATFTPILDLKNTLERLPDEKSLIDQRRSYDKGYLEIKSIVYNRLQNLASNPSFSMIDSKEKSYLVFSDYLEKELEFLQKLRKDYENKISTFKTEITKLNRLVEVEELVKIVEQSLEEGEYKTICLSLLEAKISSLKKKIIDIERLNQQFFVVRKLVTNLKDFSFEEVDGTLDLTLATEEELDKMINTLKQFLDNNKEKCQQIIDAKLDELNQLKRQAEKENNNENKKDFYVESKLIELTLFVQQLEETKIFSEDIVNNFYEKCLSLNSSTKNEEQISKKKQNTLSLEELEKELTELKQQFTSISHSLTLEVLAEPSVIISLREKLTSLLISYHSLHPNQTEYDFLWPELDRRIKKVIIDTIKNLTIKPNLATTKRVEEICTSLGLDEEKELLLEVYHAYEKQISTFEERIAQANRLNDLNQLIELIKENLEEGEDKNKLLHLVDVKISHLRNQLVELQELANQVIKINQLITSDHIVVFEDLIDLKNLINLEEADLVQKKHALQSQLETSKEKALQILHDKLSEVAVLTQRLEENQFLKKEEILQLYCENLNLESFSLGKEKIKKI